jgi:hypothetical protein
VTVVLWCLSVAAASIGAVFLGHVAATVVAVSAVAIAAIELAYSLQRDRHPELRRVLGYLLGAHPTLHPTDTVARLAQVIEMESYRDRNDRTDEDASPAATTPVADGDVSFEPATAPAASGTEHDVVLALPEDAPR